METQSSTPIPSPKPPKDYRSNVDTSRPFRSVKEAVAVFGERLLVGEIYTPKPYTYSRPPSQEITWYSPSPPQNGVVDNNNNQPQPGVLDTLKKLEAELEETKAELKLLKQRESETEIALASLNAELHKNMSKLASAEAAEAKRAAAATATPRTASLEVAGINIGEDIAREEERRKELMKRMENNPTLSQILSIGDKEGYFGGKRSERKLMKKKPIVPLVGDWLFKKKGSSTPLHNSLYASTGNVF
ncbi:hypothetical protein CCACVL1_16290 [Corchorus capsularis]|uniref:WEB family protein n=1 Tax=Corchorus capsularis TaxID=210143 RepID=A0A1R3HXU0_COCAP|nr:hypothetical protein CCACVL1_16290 [Corchorus capsularis]